MLNAIPHINWWHEKIHTVTVNHGQWVSYTGIPTHIKWGVGEKVDDLLFLIDITENSPLGKTIFKKLISWKSSIDCGGGSIHII